MKSKLHLAVIAFLLSTVSLFSQPQFRLEESGVSDNLLGVCTLGDPNGALTGYASGANGTILKTENGSPWTKQVSGTSATLYSIYFTSPLNGYTVGDNGVAKRTTDGAHWKAMNICPTTTQLRSIRFCNKVGFPNTGFATGGTSGGQGLIYRTLDGGTTWTKVFGTTFGNGGFYSTFAIKPAGSTTSDKLIVLAVRYDGSMVKSVNGGASWTAIAANIGQGASQLYFTNPTTGVVGSNSGKIYKTTSTGATWAATPQQTTTDIMVSVDFNETHTPIAIGFFVGGNVSTNTGKILTTDDGGATWANLAINLYNQNAVKIPRLCSIDLSGGEGYIVGLNGTILRLYYFKSLTEATTIDVVENAITNTAQPFPNPTSGKISIYPLKGNDLSTISIMDATGRTVIEIKAVDNNSPVEVDLFDQPEGIYFVRLVNGYNVVIKKIIKQ